jgi:hypothetical protein
MNPDAVRPGTSDALFARTIDATVYPPLVRAQETAATLIPRVAQAAAPLASPLFLGALALTLVFSLVAIRMRYRPNALVLGALLVITLTSFNPVQKSEQSPIAEVRTPRTVAGGLKREAGSGLGEAGSGMRSYRDRYMTPPEIEAPDVDVRVEPVQVYLPPDVAERLPDWSRDAMHSAERMMRQNEQLRQMMAQIRSRLRQEARRQRWRQMIAERQARLREFDLIGSP